MHPWIVKPLDWISLRLAARTVQAVPGAADRLPAARALRAAPEFIASHPPSTPGLAFTSRHRFSFPSPLPGPWPANNCVAGRFYRAGENWRERPAVILLHGWNAELGYHLSFPFLARHMARRGLNTMILLLPYHGRRKPRAADAVSNFLSDDLWRVLQATQQAVAETRAAIGWLAGEGVIRIGLWGISLGSWLAGLAACHDPRVTALLLETPVVRMDRVIAEARFCRMIRARLGTKPLDLAPLNLVGYRPQLPPERILMIACEHDLFASFDTIEELRQAWGGPTVIRAAHGHISALLSLRVARQALAWLDGALGSARPAG